MFPDKCHIQELIFATAGKLFFHGLIVSISTIILEIFPAENQPDNRGNLAAVCHHHTHCLLLKRTSLIPIDFSDIITIYGNRIHFPLWNDGWVAAAWFIFMGRCHPGNRDQLWMALSDYTRIYESIYLMVLCTGPLFWCRHIQVL